MKLKLSLITLISILFLGFVEAKAQTDTAKLSASHLRAAESFLIATGINTKFGALTDNIVKAFSAQVPENSRAAFVDVMQKFMYKYYTWDNIKGELSRIYAVEFSEDELVQMTAFFNSPVGKKYGDKSVILSQKGMLLGQQVIKDHQDELEQMIKKVQPNGK